MGRRQWSWGARGARRARRTHSCARARAWAGVGGAAGHRIAEGHECAVRRAHDGSGSARLSVSAGRGRARTVVAQWEEGSEVRERALYAHNTCNML